MKPRISQLRVPAGTPDGKVVMTESGLLVIGDLPAGSAHVIQDEGTPLTQRPVVDFQGAGVTVADDAVNGKTVVTIPGGGGGGGSALPTPDDPAQYITELGADLGYDQEFDRTGAPTTLPTGLFWVNQGAASFVERFGGGTIDFTGSGAYSVRGAFLTLPTGTSWSARAKLAFHFTATDSIGGLLLRNSATGALVTFGYHYNQGVVNTFSWTNQTTPAATLAAGPAATGGVFYLRVDRTAANTYSFFISRDGIGWASIDVGRSLSGYDQLGFGWATNTSRQMQLTCHWLRIR